MVTGLVTVSVATIMRHTVLQQHKKLPGKPHLPWGRGWGEQWGLGGAPRCGRTEAHCCSSRLIWVSRPAGAIERCCGFVLGSTVAAFFICKI